MIKRLATPLSKKDISSLRIDDDVLLSGVIYTARDQAHKRLAEALKKGKPFPVDLKGQAIYYCGPTATPKGKVIGSCGPTTCARMDSYSPDLIKAGVVAMIGKGDRSRQVRDAVKKNSGVYFLTYAGCGALLAKHVKKAAVVAYSDLGPEAIYRLEVEDFPLIVAIDSKGRSLYD